MGESQRIPVEKPQGYHCFACGTANPIGLNLEFYRQGETVQTEITLQKVHEGWENVAHGGIISTLVDEVMSWAVMCAKRVFIVTRKMSLKYVKPVGIGVPLTVSGRLLDDSNPPRITAQADVRDDGGRLLVRGKAEFIAMSGDDLSSVPVGLKEDMLDVFSKLRQQEGNHSGTPTIRSHLPGSS
jgi:acyl-coenzyme A thioesterase PaaI-like protein